jgi:hypothetical protein
MFSSATYFGTLKYFMKVGCRLAFLKFGGSQLLGAIQTIRDTFLHFFNPTPLPSRVTFFSFFLITDFKN